MVMKHQVFAAMRELGVVRAVAHFSGGNDEGGVDSVYLYRSGDESIENAEHLNAWDYDTWNEDGEKGTPRHTIVQGLSGPVDGRYGSFAGDFYVSGTVTADLSAGTLLMDGEDEERHSVPFTESY